MKTEGGGTMPDLHDDGLGGLFELDVTLIGPLIEQKRLSQQKHHDDTLLRMVRVQCVNVRAISLLGY